MKKILYVASALAVIMVIGFAFRPAQENGGKKTKGGWTVDTKASELKWKGDHADGSHSHYGTISISSGKAKFNGKTFESATFEVDMNTIDSELEADKGEKNLLGHLASEDFFNSVTFPKVDVKVDSWTENEMQVTLTIIGKELKSTFPVKTTMTADQLTATGKFTLDVSSLGIPGFTQNLEMEKESGKANQYISPKIPFELNLVMKPAKK
jgi:polyisoprenoid-binding protein YceI